MEEQKIKGDQVISRLESLVLKIKLQSPDFLELDIRVSPLYLRANSYVVDISKERVSRRVTVGSKLAYQLQMNRADGNLVRELRIAMLGVVRQARERARS